MPRYTALMRVAALVPAVLLMTGADPGTRSSLRAAWLGSNQAPQVTAADAGDPTDHVLDRGACLNASAGSSAAVVCGDLQVGHALPAMRSMNKVRGASLLYTSDHARPHPIVSANVKLPSSANVPDSVVAVLFMNPGGGAPQQVGRQKWLGSRWSPGATKRVAVSGDWVQGTGTYAYALEVTNWYGASAKMTSVSGSRIVVDRRTSPYGAGWWVAGVEQLLPQSDGSLLWVGGDGSARLYDSTTTPGAYAGNNRARPDTIKFAANEFVRHVPGKVRVHFNSSGQHVKTVDAAGAITTFVYNGSGAVDSIKVPSGSAPRHIVFAYTSGRLSQVNVHGRTAFPSIHSDGRLLSIQDPDGSTVGFTYSYGRMTSRTDRRGAITYFTYDTAKRISKVRLDMPSGLTDISTIFRFQRSQGRVDFGNYGVVTPSSAHTFIDGPRTDAVDITRFYENEHGEPWKVVDATSATTFVDRAGQWPALPTRVENASGQVISSAYDSRGRLTQVVDSSVTNVDFVSNGPSHAKTTYEWDDACDMPTLITNPMGDSTSLGYTAQCRLEWRHDGRGSLSTTTFTYDSSGRPTHVAPPADSGTTFIYESTYGNLSTVQDYLGNSTLYHQDGWGRDTLVITPVDSVRTRSVKTAYDAAGRDTLSTTFGTGNTSYIWSSPSSRSVTVPPDTFRVWQTYDAEGNRTSLVREGFVLATDGSVEQGGPEQHSYRYDAAGRMTGSIEGMAGDSMVYDPAGNVVLKIHRGNHITMEYDELNRLTRRFSEEKAYSKDCLSASGSLCYLFYWPYYPNDGDGLTIPADTAVFDYDLSGNMTVAANGAARIGRTYYANGLLKEDTLRIRTYDPVSSGGGGDPDPDCPFGICPESGGTISIMSMGALPGADADFADHVYVMKYQYDLNGRRASMVYPSELSVGTVDYTYHDWGGLETVTGPTSTHTFTFSYDGQGRRTATRYPGSGIDTVTYDPWGGIATRHNSTPSRGVIHNDGFTRDLLGRTTYVDGRLSRDVYNWYTPTGGLVATNWYSGPSGRDAEEFTLDPTGKMLATRRELYQQPATVSQYDRSPASMEILSQEVGDPMAYETNTEVDYRAGGSVNLKHTLKADSMGAGAQFRRVENHWYDGYHRLAAFQRQDATYSSGKDEEGSFEEYRYDALGRRVLVRSRKAGLNSAPDMVSYIERFVWAGDQLVGEFRSRNGTAAQMESDTDSGIHYGSVGYVHAGGIDKPISIFRSGHPDMLVEYIVPHVNWRGSFDTGTTEYGGMAECSYGGQSSCPEISWPADLTTAYGDDRNGWRGDWMGSLAKDMSDDTGLSYRRNRYYDPTTGEFTQVDPIGIAGGLNLYGYANGDPVTYSDPFGLCFWDGCVLEVAVGGLLITGAAALTAKQAPSLAPLGEALGERWNSLRGQGRELVSQGLTVQSSTPGWKGRAATWLLGLAGSLHPGVQAAAPGAGEGPARIRQQQEAEQVQKDVDKDQDGPEQEPPN